MDKPSQHPRWANDGADVTEPDEAQKDVGWDDPQSLWREFLNWLFFIIYSWVIWLDQVTHRTSDLSADQALPGGTPPAIGAGLNILANAFSARVFVDGYEQGPTTGPTANYTYSDDSDTYWDLGRDAVWTPAVVASGDPEPAVTADSVRVYMVTTDSGDRTALVDRRRDRVALTEQIDNTGNIRHATETYSSSGGTTPSPAAEVFAFKETNLIDGTAGQLHHATREIVESAVGLGLGGFYEYAQVDGVTAPLGVGTSFGRTFVWGAHLNNSGAWLVEQANVYRLDIAPSGSTAGVRFFRKTGLTPASTFAESTWDDEAAANTTRMQLPLALGLKMGGTPFGQATGVNANLTPLIEWVRCATTRTPLMLDPTDDTIADYIGVQGGETTRERIINATWVEATTNWARTNAGDAYREVISRANGIAFQIRRAASASPWGTSDWETLLRFNTGVSVLGTIASPLILSGNDDTPVSNGFYTANFPKAQGQIVTDGAAGFTSGQTGHGYTAAFNGSLVRITLTNAIVGDFACTLGMSAVAFLVGYTRVSSTVVDITVQTSGASITDLQGATMTFSFAIFGRN